MLFCRSSQSMWVGGIRKADVWWVLMRGALYLKVAGVMIAGLLLMAFVVIMVIVVVPSGLLRGMGRCKNGNHLPYTGLEFLQIDSWWW